ncbi:hypothetical protein C8R44DRAFT_742057 [Mycena epipterygia]|nr:hypothetical protein C8R44DRAFT_742057 [Mycena epipterygia]
MPRNALEPSEFKLNGHMYSCYKSYRGNSGSQFKMPKSDKQATGFIQKIWQMPLQGYLKTFLLVEVHRPVRNKVPFNTLEYLATAVVDASPSFNSVVIEPEEDADKSLQVWQLSLFSLVDINDIAVVVLEYHGSAYQAPLGLYNSNSLPSPPDEKAMDHFEQNFGTAEEIDKFLSTLKYKHKDAKKADSPLPKRPTNHPQLQPHNT